MHCLPRRQRELPNHYTSLPVISVKTSSPETTCTFLYPEGTGNPVGGKCGLICRMRFPQGQRLRRREVSDGKLKSRENGLSFLF